ncbi:MAG: ATP-binding cassette domain-containing protein [Thermodesulfobacteriota bacterium]
MEWLSGGEIQRVTIVMALINNPSVIIADEPTAHLDTKLSREFMEIVGRFKDERKTVLIASHVPLCANPKLSTRSFTSGTERSMESPDDLSSCRDRPLRFLDTDHLHHFIFSILCHPDSAAMGYSKRKRAAAHP